MVTSLKALLAELLGGAHPGVGDLKGPQLRRIAWLILVGLVGVLILVLGFSPGLQSPSSSPRTAEPHPAPGNASGVMTSQDGPGALEADLERRVAEALSQVEGAGEVIVRITFATGESYDYAQNTTREESTTREQEAGAAVRETTEVRTTGEVVTIQETTTGASHPVVRSVIQPTVQGVLVVSDGARDPRLREEITEAVVTLLAIQPHRVSVLPRGR